jgi:dihydroxyacetone kinase
MTLVSTVGGAGGPLYGSFFLQAGMKVVGKTELTLDDWTAALEAAVTGVIGRGKAEPGDTTMVDALLPALKALQVAAGQRETFQEALRRSADAAEAGMLATIPLVARKGRPATWASAAPVTRTRGHIFVPAAQGRRRYLAAVSRQCRGFISTIGMFSSHSRALAERWSRWCARYLGMSRWQLPPV